MGKCIVELADKVAIGSERLSGHEQLAQDHLGIENLLNIFHEREEKGTKELESMVPEGSPRADLGSCDGFQCYRPQRRHALTHGRLSSSDQSCSASNLC